MGVKVAGSKKTGSNFKPGPAKLTILFFCYSNASLSPNPLSFAHCSAYEPAGVAIPVRLLQSSNAVYPILVSPSGISILVRLLHCQNALAPMLVTGHPSIVLGIQICSISLSINPVISTVSSSVIRYLNTLADVSVALGTSVTSGAWVTSCTSVASGASGASVVFGVSDTDTSASL